MMAENSKKAQGRQIEEACPECGKNSMVTDYESGEHVCASCGTVDKERIVDRKQEWRAYDRTQFLARSRTGPPSTLSIHDKGLMTTIGGNLTVRGKMTSEKTYDLYRMRKWQRTVRVSYPEERTLATALSDLSKLSSALNLPKYLLEDGSNILRKVVKGKLLKGRSSSNVVAAIVYYECRQSGIPRTLVDVCKAANDSRKKDVSRAYRFLLKKLELKPQLRSPVVFISQYCNKLELSGKTEQKAMKILETVKESCNLILGKDPRSIAAACTYIASVLTGEHRTQRDIATVSGITEVTVRNRYKELMDNLYIMVSL
jgi:transcription initiation factor TFIIB